jgi:hypothetical protein
MSNVIKAVPTVEENTNNVYYWEITGAYSNNKYQKQYVFIYNCKMNNCVKPLNEWTKEQIQELYPDHVFQNSFNRYASLKDNPMNKAKADNSFDINSL